MHERIFVIESIDKFKFLLSINPGLLVIKFGAEWCGPCKKIESCVVEWMNKMPYNVQTAIIDIDESFELYAYLKSKKMCRSIPAILMYNAGNESYIFDDAVITSNVSEINKFFERCIESSKTISI